MTSSGSTCCFTCWPAAAAHNSGKQFTPKPIKTLCVNVHVRPIKYMLCKYSNCPYWYEHKFHPFIFIYIFLYYSCIKYFIVVSLYNIWHRLCKCCLALDEKGPSFCFYDKNQHHLCRLCRDLLMEAVPVTRVDFTSVLPRFLSLYILSFLNPMDLCSAAQVCWHWRILAEQVRDYHVDNLWPSIVQWLSPGVWLPLFRFARTVCGSVAASEGAGSSHTRQARRSLEPGKAITPPAWPAWTGWRQGRLPAPTVPLTRSVLDRPKRQRKGRKREESGTWSVRNCRRRKVS